MQIFGCSNDAPEIISHLRWIARGAISIGAIAAVGLAITLNILTDGSGTTYGELIQSHSIVQAYLGSALLIGGFILVACTAVITWLIALYSSFRVAGPLYRFSRNLERAIARGPSRPIPIRKGDCLHRDALLLEHSLKAMETHYRELDEALNLALSDIEQGKIERAQPTAAKLGELIKRAAI